MNARTRGTRGKLAVLLGTLALLGSMLPFVASVALAATFSVAVASNTFTPQNLGNITAGDTITWTSTQGFHDVVSADIPLGATPWSSGPLALSVPYSRTFTVAGNYRYFCSIHATAADANLATQSTTLQVGQFDVIADIIAPVAPTGLTATAADSSQINLAWTPSTSTDVARQELFRNTTNTRGTATPVQTFTNNTTAAYSDTGLTAATTYFYWLEAVDGALNRSAPATASAATTSVTTWTVLLNSPVNNVLFVPQNVGTINAGDTITWQVLNTRTHDVTSANIPANAEAWASPTLGAGATFSRTFTVAGNYRYFCTRHATAELANAPTQDPTRHVGQFTVQGSTQQVLFDIATTLQLSVTPASIDFGSVSPAAAATTAVGATVANVKSNGGWTLAVKSIGTNGTDESPGDDAVFTSGSQTVPVGRMGWRVNPGPATPGSAAYTSLSDANSTIGTPAVVGTPDAGVDTFLQYQLTSQFSDPVGLDYRTVLLFTATSP